MLYKIKCYIKYYIILYIKSIYSITLEYNNVFKKIINALNN